MFTNPSFSNVLVKQEIPDREDNTFITKNTILSSCSQDILMKSELIETHTYSPELLPIKLESPSTENFDNLIEPDADHQSSLEENLEVSLEDLDEEFNKDLINESFYENETTVYKCPMCEKVFQKLHEYKAHKKKHFLDKRTCKICNKILQNIGKLEEHMNKHLGLKPYKCEECESAFISIHYLKLHKKCHNTEAIYKCKLCPKSFRTVSSLRCHQVVHAVKTDDFKCKVCRFDCNDAATYKSHMADHGRKSEIQCGLCNKTFNTDKGLENHLSSHKELNFPCEYCGKIFPTMYKIKRHIKRAHIPNKCEECDKVFYDRVLYTKHKKEHESEKQHECQYCQKTFEKQKNLSEHIRLQHKQDGEMKKCEVCGKEFINNALLKNHAKTHDKTFQCSHCDRVFSSRSNLEVHSITHSGVKNYKCDICNKMLRSKTSLKNHVASHSDERQFQCEVCEKKFKTNRRLYVHKMCHATEEKYQCEICLQKFKVKQYLKMHMNKHSKVKPFECHVCKKRFKHKKSRDKHVRIGKHKEITDVEHDCDFCDETFTTRDLLLDHFADIHHKENVINNLNGCEEEDVTMDEGEVLEEEKKT